MPRSAIAFSSNQQRSRPLDAARLVNLFPEQPPLGARAPSLQVGINAPLKSVLYGAPGTTVLETLGTGRARAGRYALGYLWALYGTMLYRVDSAGNSTACTGDAIPASGTAMMSDNGKQLAVMVGTDTYVVGSLNATASFTITGGTLTAATNKVSMVSVNSVDIMSGAVDWSDSNEATAAAVVANINAHASSPDYTAKANGATVVIEAVDPGDSPNGFSVAITLAGNVTITPSATSMSGGASTSTTVQKITSANYPTSGISSIDYVDGYGVFSAAGSSRQWGITQLYDFTSIDALDFAAAESAAGDLVRVIVVNREIWLFSTDGFSVWADAGTSPFPFQRIPGAVGTKGCGAALSPALVDSTVFWLGSDRVVYRASGYQPQRISTHAMEEILRVGDISDAEGMTYTMGGHVFYVLTLPTLDRTLVFDVATSGWWERQSGTSLVPAAWDVRWLTPAFGKIYAGMDAGKLCELDLDAYSENGAAIRRVAVSSPLYNDGKRASVLSVEFECELGVGLPSGQGSAPEVMLRVSYDGGATWGNERRQPLGPTGVRRTRAVFRRLGAAREMMLEFSISDPVKIAAYGMNYTAVGAAA